MIPVESKQVAFVSYNDDDSALVLHFHTGEMVKYLDVSRTKYEQLANSPNKYDDIVALTSGNYVEQDHETYEILTEIYQKEL